MKKSEYWKSTAEDVLDLSAKVYPIAARIYRNKYMDGGKNMPALDKSKDLAWNFANQIGMSDKQGFIEVVRLYNAIHSECRRCPLPSKPERRSLLALLCCEDHPDALNPNLSRLPLLNPFLPRTADHEGGNVSAHTTHLVGSALADPFLSYSAGLAGLAGPLHGLANQEVLRFILDMQKQVGNEVTPEKVKDYIWSVLKSGRVIPGYGHAVLRKPDPRFMALQQFAAADKEIAQDPIFKLVNSVSRESLEGRRRHCWRRHARDDYGECVSVVVRY